MLCHCRPITHSTVLCLTILATIPISGCNIAGRRSSYFSHLNAAYHNTDYLVYEFQDSLSIGKRTHQLDMLLSNYSSSTAIFITAWNPYSRKLTRDENDRRNEQLIARVKAIGDFPVFLGEGKARNGDWPPELSYLILGVHTEMANQLADEFGQNAYLTYNLGGPAKIVWRQ
mmetsp:Transcript_50603/g.83894  ORF Transcript_50603/g.83894 Transcript_50603/m.83894 type:complete len:172 (+) Transcript_50603:181-696(+)